MILVMLHMKFPPHLSCRGHKKLPEAVSTNVQYEILSRSAGAFIAGTPYTQVSVTNRMLAASIRNK